MSGGVQLLGNLSLPYNRLGDRRPLQRLCWLGVASLIEQTRLGLFVRGVTQNRADCLLHGREHRTH